MTGAVRGGPAGARGALAGARGGPAARGRVVQSVRGRHVLPRGGAAAVG